MEARVNVKFTIAKFNEDVRVEIRTTEVLNQKEKREVIKAVKNVFESWEPGKVCPSIGEIKKDVARFNPELPKKLISIKRYY